MYELIKESRFCKAFVSILHARMFSLCVSLTLSHSQKTLKVITLESQRAEV